MRPHYSHCVCFAFVLCFYFDCYLNGFKCDFINSRYFISVTFYVTLVLMNLSGFMRLIKRRFSLSVILACVNGVKSISR